MYLNGYDTWHLPAMLTSTATVELLLRTYWRVRSSCDETWREDVDAEGELVAARRTGDHPRFQSLALAAHGVAAGGNALKTAVVGNPGAVNVAQWLMLLRVARRWHDTPERRKRRCSGIGPKPTPTRSPVAGSRSIFLTGPTPPYLITDELPLLCAEWPERCAGTGAGGTGAKSRLIKGSCLTSAIHRAGIHQTLMSPPVPADVNDTTARRSPAPPSRSPAGWAPGSS